MIEVNGRTKILGIIGNPIEHTQSPAIHNMISEEMGINAVYVPFAANDDLDAMINGLYALGVKGLNVTVPYKTDVMGRLCGLDDMASRIGAVNTLKYTDGGYYGYNTDILGLKRELEDEGISLKGRDTVILGAGGAARAVAFLCVSGEPESITIVNRTPDKAMDICRDLVSYARENGPEGLSSNIEVIALDKTGNIKGDDLIVFQCTNVGLSPRDNECVLNDKAFYDNVSVGVDLIYKPSETVFMKNVRAAGGKAYNGLKMLIYQAVSAYEIWNDVTVPAGLVSRIEGKLK